VYLQAILAMQAQQSTFKQKSKNAPSVLADSSVLAQKHPNEPSNSGHSLKSTSTVSSWSQLIALAQDLYLLGQLQLYKMRAVSCHFPIGLLVFRDVCCLE
jgi:hypothetical protein